MEFTASALYLDGKVKTYTGFDLNATTIRDFAGARLPYTPKWSLNFGSRYQFPVSENLRGFVGSDLAYRSTSSAFFGTNPRERISNYTTLDLSAGIPSADDAWSFSIWGRNVTDEYYWTNVGRSIDTYARVAAMPATYGVTFAIKR